MSDVVAERNLSLTMLPVAPVLGLAIGGVCDAAGLAPDAAICAGVAIICATWWIFECLHIAAVGLVPFVVLPLAGILTHREVAASYGHTMILLLMGGFLLSAAMERSGAHRRIAVMMVRAVGGAGGKRLVLGFMLATASLSMWISNTATALMMLPIAMAVLSQCRDDQLKVALAVGHSVFGQHRRNGHTRRHAPQCHFHGAIGRTIWHRNDVL